MLSAQEPESVQLRLIRKAKKLGITLGDPNKLNSTQIEKDTTEKTKAKTVEIVEQSGLRDRIKKRKACWKMCENTWKADFQERCFTLSALLKKTCEKDVFKERLLCVRQKCR